jgi:ADP-ribose pyrophosphatase YjhB (NUDIX family)
MLYPFGEDFRALVARQCAAFTRTPALDTHGLKRAAVAVTLLESDDGSGETAFVLTRRGRALRAHKGQFALPGGRCEEGETADAAALRELEEEVGLRLRADDVLGMLDDYPTRSGYLITPVVVWAEQAQPLPKYRGGRVGASHSPRGDRARGRHRLHPDSRKRPTGHSHPHEWLPCACADGGRDLSVS